MESTEEAEGQGLYPCHVIGVPTKHPGPGGSQLRDVVPLLFPYNPFDWRFEMGEIADEMISGFTCQCCGGFLDGEEPGFSRWCWDDRDEYDGPIYVDGKLIPNIVPEEDIRAFHEAG